MKARWYPYYPDEWLVGCARLNLADCGLYITACMLMYSHGGPIAVVDLKAACQDHGNAVNAALTRLVKFGKLIREGDILRNLRVEKELEKAWKRSGNGLENVRKRWRNGEEKEPTSANINGVASADLIQRGNANHNHNHNHKRNPLKSPVGDDGFADFWQIYPKKVAKPSALKAWAKACKVADPPTIIDGARRYVAAHPADYEFWKNPSGWLNDARWADEQLLLGGNGYAREVSPEEHEAARLQARREAGLRADD
jgi:uncharacterized protein YdaU (DUF1376 family)